MINLRPINQDNVMEIVKLKADEKFVGSNAISLAEAYAYHQSKGEMPIVFGIYNDDAPVGFVMIDYYDEASELAKNDNEGEPFYYNWRLMIDEKYQNRGFGRPAMNLIIQELKKSPKGRANAFFTGVMLDNEVAHNFYKSFGFVETGEVEGNELFLRMPL